MTLNKKLRRKILCWKFEWAREANKKKTERRQRGCWVTWVD